MPCVRSRCSALPPVAQPVHQRYRPAHRVRSADRASPFLAYGASPDEPAGGTRRLGAAPGGVTGIAGRYPSGRHQCLLKSASGSSVSAVCWRLSRKTGASFKACPIRTSVRTRLGDSQPLSLALPQSARWRRAGILLSACAGDAFKSQGPDRPDLQGGAEQDQRSEAPTPWCPDSADRAMHGTVYLTLSSSAPSPQRTTAGINANGGDCRGSR